LGVHHTSTADDGRESPQIVGVIHGKVRAKALHPPDEHGRASRALSHCCAGSSKAYGLPATTGRAHLGRVRAGSLHRWFVIASAAVILAVTLLPVAGEEPERWLACVVCGERGIADVLVNVLLFLPFGAALAAAGVRPQRCVLGGALLSAGVEFAQLSIPGRDPSLGDVVSNTVGSGLGAVLVATAPYWLLPPRAQAARLSWAAALAAAALGYATGWLLTPTLPQAHYFSLWTPNLGHLEWYRGHVRDAMIGEVRIPAGPIANSAAVRELLLSPQGFSLHVRAIAGPRTAELGALVAVYDEHGREILLLGPERDDLVFRLRTRATALRLDQPDLRLPDVLRAVAPGDPLDVTVLGRRGRYSMTVGSSGGAGLGFTVGSGWAVLMYPEALPAWLKALLSLAWVGAMWVPAGFWARTRQDGWVTAGALTAGLLAVPAITPLCATPILQWGAAGLGALAGVIARLVLERRR
jgi:VanZ like protein